MLPLSDVQSTNLQLLYTIRVGLASDPVDTCRKYGLDAEHAARLSSLDPEQMWNQVCAIGHTSLFVPRSDLLTLIDAPHALAATLAAAHPALPSQTLEA
jgi:hypothetical protein